jgi:hypothetical protein
MVWNRLRYVKNPDTGKRVSRLNPSSEWITTDVPHLRIVPDELWSTAKDRQTHTRRAIAATGKLGTANRPCYLFSGLTKCGEAARGSSSAPESADVLWRTRPGHVHESPDHTT